MMTAATSIAVLQYLLTDILAQPADGPLRKALKQDFIETIQDRLGLHNKVIDEDLQYKDSEDNMVCHHCGHCGLIKAFEAYYTNFITDLDCTFDHKSDWRAITSSEFDQFHISPSFVSSSTMSPNGQAANASSSRDPVHEFKKDIKCGPSAFTELKEDKQWDQWYHSTQAQALAQDVSEILDTNYKPSTRLSSSKRSRSSCSLYSRRP